MIKIILSGEIGWEITTEQVRQFLDSAKGDDIEVYLDTPGGGASSGIRIYNYFRDYRRDHPDAQMLLYVKGMDASMGSYLTVNPAWNDVTIEDNIPFMIHNPWGGVIGDYREVEAMFNVLDGLANILAAAYAQKMKKSISEVRALMDAETWYFGQEIINAGFADKIQKTDNPKDKAARQGAIAVAQIAVKTARKRSGPMTPDVMTEIAAMIKPEIKPEPVAEIPEPQTGITPAQIAGKIIEEVNAMTLTEFLASDPAAQIEHNKMLNSKFDEGAKSVQDRIAGVLPYIKPDSVYPAAIKSLAADVIEGKYEVSSIRAAVATFDAMNESENSEAAATESEDTADATAQQTAALSEDGQINNELDYNEIIKQSKIAKGMEVN